MARKILLLISALTLSLLALTGCNMDNESGGDSYSADNEESSPTATPGRDTAAACDSASPGSSAQESCEAQGVPGVTENPDRCGSTTPSPIASGIVQGTFGPYCDNAIANTYDDDAVPDGADTTITVSETAADSTLEMIAEGFAPNTQFIVTLHDSLCGAEPADAGPEYTDDQSSQSQNLVLDFTTDDGGNSTASVTVPWLLPDDGIGRSLLLNAGPGGDSVNQAVACVNLER
ncbi:hypothetical protein OL239_14790 [Arthrobacter sp. ATA002]|uniref:hypothetical protein n=1 Tax=Arthrobacter sp. ATA002 TaxID=2991715 RepID=UPI0022A7598E|nr:hypothetical protein [Arthrobacter sp. ATA002]WAP51134.1 hypothetical protein OL239_14790 [Arthrobacter sp. ATA002]